MTCRVTVLVGFLVGFFSQVIGLQDQGTVKSAHSGVKLNSTNLHQHLTQAEWNQILGTTKLPEQYTVSYLKLHRGRRSLRLEERDSESQNIAGDGANPTMGVRAGPAPPLLDPHFMYVQRWGNRTEHTAHDAWLGEVDGCYYRSDNAALAICGGAGVKGLYYSPNKELFFIQPLPKRFLEEDGSSPHIIIKRSPSENKNSNQYYNALSPIYSSYIQQFSNSNNAFKKITDNIKSTGKRKKQDTFKCTHEDQKNITFPNNARRKKRSLKSSAMHVETAVFIDRELYQHMSANYPKNTERELLRFVLAMINGVQLLYHDPSLGHPVNFLLKRLEILHEDPSGLRRPQDIDDFLSSFCGWQRQENPIADSDPLHWDHALILTGLDLYVVSKAGKLSHQVVGLAPVGGMCTTTSSCTVNEGRHFESVYVVAHEIGHNLGMRHDGPLADNECDPTSYIMSPTLGSGKITWSTCSRRYLQTFLDSSQSHCLLDHGSSAGPLDHSAEGSLPGERFNADQQCMLKYGAGSAHSLQQPSEEICRDLHCRRERYTWTSHPALEGTQCGFNMWCRGGECIARSPPISTDDSTSASYTQAPVWSPWSPFSECASACLDGPDGHQNSALEEGSTGVRVSSRRCNLHRFQNNGQGCKGHDKKYQTCIAPQCQNINRMTVREFSDEICTRARDVDSELTGQSVLLQDRNPVDACAVWCATRGGGRKSRGWSLPDGTACRSGVAGKPGAASGFYCIAGRCEEFQCKVNSDTRFQLPGDFCEGFTNRVDLWEKPGEYTRGNYKGKRGLTWQQSGTCHYNCMEDGSGIRLLTSKNKPKMNNIQLCHPNANECSRIWSTFQYATAICTKYKERVKRLSGLGMQISPTADEEDRACRVACQDEKLHHRFYLVNGPAGWFPFGTDCSRGKPIRAYCVSGKCLEFGTDGIPITDTSWLLKSTTPILMRL